MPELLDSNPSQLAPKSPKTRPDKPRAAIEAVELQRLMMDDARKADVKPSVRALIARSWVQVQEMRLRLAMKGPPRPVDVEPRGKRKSRSSAAPLDGPDAPAK